MPDGRFAPIALLAKLARGPTLAALRRRALDGDFGFGIVLLYHGTCQITDLTRICVRDSSPTAIAQVLNFTRVPEPGTLALLLGAIGVMGAAQRKRNRA